MLSDRIAQLYEADQYAGEPCRFRVIAPDIVQVSGRHHVHTLRRNGHGWVCSCEYFQVTEAVYHGCAHSIALERVFSSSPELLTGTAERAERMLIRDQEV